MLSERRYLLSVESYERMTMYARNVIFWLVHHQVFMCLTNFYL